MATISSRRFSYSKDTQTFSAEASDLQDVASRISSSFYIQSERTGEIRLFLFEGTDRDGSGEDIAGWRYFCPGEGYRALIIND